MNTDLSQIIITNAAGMVKTPDDVTDLLRAETLTHVTVGSITVDKRNGNPEPTFWTTPDGSFSLNCRGLPCLGLDHYKNYTMGEELNMSVHSAGKKLIMSITSTTDENDWQILANWAAYCSSDIIELNLSCPNKWLDGKPVGMAADDPEAILRIVELVRKTVGDVPLAIKLPPYSPSIPPHILSMLQALNIDMFTSCNTAGGHTTTIDGEKVLSMPQAGLSGSILHTQAVMQVRYLLESIPYIPVIGVGGISSGADAKRFLDAGATGFGIGTHFFLNGPKVFGEVVQELVELTEEEVV